LDRICIEIEVNSGGEAADKAAALVLALHAASPVCLNTEPNGSVLPSPLRCLVRRALGRHSTWRSGAARACRRVDHGPGREVRHDPDGYEEACRRPGAGGARHHGEGWARTDLQAWSAPTAGR